MAFDYTDFKNLGTEMITEFGQTAVLRHAGAVTGQGRMRRVTVTETAVKVVEVEQETMVPGDSDTGITTARQMRVLYMSVETGVVPSEKDEIVMRGGADILTLSKVDPISPGGDDVVYKLMVEV